MPKLQPNAAAFRYDDNLPKQSTPSLGARVKTAAVHAKGGGKFPYRRRPWRRLCDWFLSRRFQIALQLASGLVFASLFVFVRQIRLLEGCLAVIFCLVGLTLLSPHPHVGCLLMTSSVFLFCAAYIPVYTGAIISLAWATGPGSYAGSLIAFGVVGFIPLAALRATPGNPSPGLLASLLYGIVIIFSIPRVSVLTTIWRTALAQTMAALCVSVACIMLAGTLVLPSLAGHQLQDNLSKALKGMGHRLSCYASHIDGDEDDGKHRTYLPDEHAVPNASKMDSKQGDVEITDKDFSRLREKMRVPELGSSLKEFMTALEHRTDPQAPKLKIHASKHIPAIDSIALWQLLDECKLLMLEASFEPAYFQKGPLDLQQWGQVLIDMRSLLTRIGTLAILVDGGKVFNSRLLKKECGLDPMPAVSIVLAEIASVCVSLSEAIKHAGTAKPEQLLTMVSWSEIKEDLAEIVSTAKAGYWERHFNVDVMRLNEDAEALETRVLLYLVTLLHGIISAVTALEASVPVALGFSPKDVTRRSLGTSRLHRLKFLHDLQAKDETTAHMSSQQRSFIDSQKIQSPDISGDLEGQLPQPPLQSEKNSDVAGGAYTSLQVDAPKQDERKIALTTSSWKQHIMFMKPFMESVTGISVYRRLKPVVWEGSITTFSSWSGLKSTLRDRRVQYGFKFWLSVMIILVAVIIVANNDERARKWKLHYAFITAVILAIEKVEAVVWKSVQRVIGTLLGGTLAYLIMLRPYIHTRGVAVGALAITSIFVIANCLDSRLRYTVYLTMLTTTSLTFCQYSACCKPSQDFHTWVERVVNIIGASLFAAGMSWIVLPWYASDSQLLLIADAFRNSAQLFEDIYTAFQKSCEDSAKGIRIAEDNDAYKVLSSTLDQKVVQPVKAAHLGLKTEGVLWKEGFLSTPRIVERLVEDMKDLIHNLTSMMLAVTSAPEEYGNFSASILRHFLLPMEEDNNTVVSLTKELAKACYPVLKHGPNEETKEEIKGVIVRFGVTRTNIHKHLDMLKKDRHKQRLRGQEVPTDAMTPADLLKLGSFMVSMSHVMDNIMLIARVIIDDSYADRESPISALVALDGTRRDLSHDHHN